MSDNVRNSWAHGSDEVTGLLLRVLPFPPAAKGESTQDHSRRLTSSERGNAYLTALLGTVLLDVERMGTQAALMDVAAFNADYMVGKDLTDGTLQEAFCRVAGRYEAADHFLKASVLLRTQRAGELEAFSPNLALKLEMLEHVMKNVKGAAVRIFDDNNGKTVTYTGGGMVSLVLPSHYSR